MMEDTANHNRGESCGKCSNARAEALTEIITGGLLISEITSFRAPTTWSGGEGYTLWRSSSGHLKNSKNPCQLSGSISYVETCANSLLLQFLFLKEYEQCKKYQSQDNDNYPVVYPNYTMKCYLAKISPFKHCIFQDRIYLGI